MRTQRKVAPLTDASLAEEMREGLRKNMPDSSTGLEGFRVGHGAVEAMRPWGH
jgi:hypothetical protein